jgi:hypothetical protein
MSLTWRNAGMGSEGRRLMSFKTWPHSFLLKEQFTLAGFYYTGFSDTVKCPFCALALSKWKEGMVPMYEHHYWKSSCRFLLNKIIQWSNNKAVNDNLMVVLGDEAVCTPDATAQDDRKYVFLCQVTQFAQ